MEVTDTTKELVLVVHIGQEARAIRALELYLDRRRAMDNEPVILTVSSGGKKGG